MNRYEDLPRLKAGDKTGTRHIAVSIHNSLSYHQHWHDYFEIEIVLSGTGTHYYNASPYTIEKGDGYLLTPVDFHGIEATNPIELLHISFDAVWLSEDMRALLYNADYLKKAKFQNEEYEGFIAVAQLLKKGVSVSEACFASGFGSLSNFSAVFKKRCAMSPRNYRSSNQQPRKP
jgi:AraC-like DNA-binding protein